MIKKTLATVLAVLAVFLFISCDDSGGGDKPISAKEYTTPPAVTSVQDLPPSGATAEPYDAAEAVAMVTATVQAVNQIAAITSDGPMGNIAVKARPTESETFPIDITRDEYGTISYKGYLKYSYTYPSESTQIKANTTYTDAEILRMNAELNGTVTDSELQVQVYNGGYQYPTYTINGDSKERLYYELRGTYAFGDDLEYWSDLEITMKHVLSLAYSAAYSIKDDNGRGGKFIVSYVNNYTYQEVIDYYDDDFESFIVDFLQNAEADLTVYNDDNEIKYETKVPLMNLVGNLQHAFDALDLD